MKRFQNNMGLKKGAAVSAAVSFAFLLAVVFVLLLVKQPAASDYNKISFEEKQAHFAARAAMQHFMLKAKLFNNELFEAVRIAQGKNPYFSFAQYPLSKNGIEPLFKPLSGRSGIYVPTDNQKIKGYFMLLPETNMLIELGSYFNPACRFLAPAVIKKGSNSLYLSSLALPQAYKANKYLQYFIRDCTNDIKDMELLQPPLETRAADNVKGFDIITDKGCPYTMTYRVTNASALPLTGASGEERLEIFVRGSVIGADHKKASQTQKHIHSVFYVPKQ